MDISYSRSQFSWLPQAVSKGLINHSSQKVTYVSMMIDPVINGFSPNEIKIYLHICNTALSLFFIRGLWLRFSNTSHFDSLDMFIKTVFDWIKFDMTFFLREVF